MADEKGSFAQKLNHLFETVKKPDGAKYTQGDVVKGTGGVISRVYLWKLRSGRSTNPGYHIVQAIANFFDVDPSYFFEEDGDETDAISLARDDDLVDKIALRSSRLDEEGKQAVLSMIDYIIKSKEPGEEEPEEN
jgi:transcriptional regulator with XRE-family HTH domain